MNDVIKAGIGAGILTVLVVGFATFARADDNSCDDKYNKPVYTRSDSGLPIYNYVNTVNPWCNGTAATQGDHSDSLTESKSDSCGEHEGGDGKAS